VILMSVWQRFHSLLMPFIVAFLFAYALNPVVEWLTSRKLPKTLVILLIVGGILAVMVGVGLLIIPRLVEEAALLAENVPSWLATSKLWIDTSVLPWISGIVNVPVEDMITRVQTSFSSKTETLFQGFGNWSVKALGGLGTLISSLFNIILIPILTLYYLNEYDSIKGKLFKLVPDKYHAFSHDCYVGINRVLAGYLRGQVLVILFLSSWIGLGLWLVAGVPYALLLGITAGCLNVLPYIGASTALLLTIIVSMFQPEALPTTIKALIVFLSAQILESNFITPRLVGDRVGLNPIAVIFLVLLFATLFGIIGMLLAIPVGAVGLVYIKVWMNYRKSKVAQ
jgi:predicted PurR-regulated permease PerM